MRKEEILQRVEVQAFENLKKYSMCCQSTLFALQKTLQLQDDTVLKASYALSGGGGATGEGFCGALSAGMIAIGLTYGWGEAKLLETERAPAMKLAKVLIEKYKEEYGSPICKDIQKMLFGKVYDFWDPIQHQEMVEAGALDDKCVNVVGKGARWAAEIIIQNEKIKI
ncbi:MAG: C_GCAxxG_C_C family protein [Spirochaetes bacterium]|nr:C_GCAxxG_C_C family protein [Spirochaetota bacterium]